jgi:hypothetical protein
VGDARERCESVWEMRVGMGDLRCEFRCEM